jgi:hypothetical protein
MCGANLTVILDSPPTTTTDHGRFATVLPPLEGVAVQHGRLRVFERFGLPLQSQVE